MPDSILGWLNGYEWRDLDGSTVVHIPGGAYAIRKPDGTEIVIDDTYRLHAFLHAINPDVPAQPQRLYVTANGDHL